MGEKIVYTGQKEMFCNSDCIFVEYHDVIAMPWFTMMVLVKNYDNLYSILNMDTIKDYDLTGLLEWYIYRKHRNVFKSLGSAYSKADDKFYNDLLTKVMSISDVFYTIPVYLKFLTSLRILMADSGLVNKVIIYSENNEPHINDLIKKYFSKLGQKIQYLYGDFRDSLKIIPENTTYVFSDIEKVKILEEEKRLNCISILIANGLRYNYLEDDSTKIKVDLKEMMNHHIFKYSFFDNFDLSDALSSNQLPRELENLQE